MRRWQSHLQDYRQRARSAVVPHAKRWKLGDGASGMSRSRRQFLRMGGLGAAAGALRGSVGGAVRVEAAQRPLPRQAVTFKANRPSQQWNFYNKQIVGQTLVINCLDADLSQTEISAVNDLSVFADTIRIRGKLQL